MAIHVYISTYYTYVVGGEHTTVDVKFDLKMVKIEAKWTPLAHQ
jgi:hypothetical protein